MGGPNNGGVLGGGGVSQFLFGDAGAGAAQQAALAQQTQVQQNYNLVKGITDQATASGMASYEKDLNLQDKNLSRQEQLISQIDPTIIEASQQALKLLRGEQSSTLAPMQNQRALQRTKLVNSLREQLGPGAETSTAGIQALTKFDSETNNLISGQQQSAIQLLGNTAGQFNGVRPNMGQAIAQRSGYGQGASNLLMQQASFLNSASQPLAQNAGAPYVGDVMLGKQNAAFGQQLFGAGATALGGYFGGAGGAAGATASTPSPQQFATPTPSASNGYANSLGGTTYSNMLAGY